MDDAVARATALEPSLPGRLHYHLLPVRRRTVLDLTFSSETDGVRVIAREGVGRVEDGQIFEWSDEPELAVTEAEIEAMGSEGAEQ